MGRKKRKVVQEVEDEGPPLEDMPMHPAVEAKSAAVPAPAAVDSAQTKETKEDDKPLKSGYAMTSHSAEVVDEDYYVSDGSDEEDEEDIALRNVEMVLAGSRMGVMRRGIHHPMLVQPNRQWVKEDKARKIEEEPDKTEDEEAAEKQRLKEQEEELAKLDPAQRAAKLLAEKQRKLEEAKVTARRLESEENAGRDPCLFSKRTAFDIRFDQIDDKPWTRGDPTDYFNYGLTEEDWLEYAQQQLTVRQELTDASRQRRPPDPTIVPVTPRLPTKQAPRVAVAVPTDDEKGAGSENGDVKELGPMLVKKENDGTDSVKKTGTGPTMLETKIDVPVAGGAWGAGAAPGSLLAKLIEEQEMADNIPGPGSVTPSIEDSKYGPAGGGGNSYGRPDASQIRSEYGANNDFGSEHGWQDDGDRDHGHYGGGGGRGYGRGPPGRGGGRGRGRGFRDDRGFGGRGGRGYMDGGGRDHMDGGDYHRKRPREDYGGRGGWRR